jgi:hypothetical protein
MYSSIPAFDISRMMLIAVWFIFSPCFSRIVNSNTLAPDTPTTRNPAEKISMLTLSFSVFSTVYVATLKKCTENHAKMNGIL